MFDAYKAEKEIKRNIIDYIIDWKNIRNPEIKNKLRSLWMSSTPQEGSLLSELLVENNYSYVTDEKQSNIETIEPKYFKEFLNQMYFIEEVLKTEKLPKLKNNNEYFLGKSNLQSTFISLVKAQWFNPKNVLFDHQVQAINSAIKGKDFILSSGTGSGKTEAFLFPTLAKLFNESDEERKQSGIRVLIIYPMNALINNQVSRLQALIGAQNPSREPIRFALYNSKLKPDIGRFQVYQNETVDYSQWPDLQVINREELRENPPHILVTNYSMLEYALIRPADLPLFMPERQKLHTIILDEAHTYIGAMAAEIAMLIRRTLIAFNKNSSEIQFFATSATLGDPDKDGGYTLRKFAADLFTKDVENVDFIDGIRITPFNNISKTKNISTNSIIELLDTLEQTLEQDKLEKVLKRFPYINSKSLPDALYQIFTCNNDIISFINFLGKKPYKISDVGNFLNLDSEENSIEKAFLFVKYLSIIKSNNIDDPVIKIRLHSVIEAPSGVFVCLECGKYYSSYKTNCSNPGCNCKKALLELVVCSQCGEPYLCEEISHDGSSIKINWKSQIGENKICLSTLQGKNADFSTCSHCGIQRGIIKQTSNDLLANEKEIVDPEVSLYRKSFFQPISVSPELIQKIAIDSLYPNLKPHKSHAEKWLPGEGRRLLTFTDSRQGAARFPTSIDWLHEIYLRVRLMYDATKNTIKNASSEGEKNLFATFSETGKLWLKFSDNYTNKILDIISSLKTYTCTISNEDIINEIKSKEIDFFSVKYGIKDLASDISNTIYNNEIKAVKFKEVIKNFANENDFRELIGIFDQIPNLDSHLNPLVKEKIAYWLMVRSFGMITRSRYLPENVGLVYIDFPQIPKIVNKLKTKTVFLNFSSEKVKNIVYALIMRMRDTGFLFIDRPYKAAEELTSVANYIFQNITLNKYMVLEKSMVPKESTVVAHWYNLSLKKETAAIQLIKKAINVDDISLDQAHNIIATAWLEMTDPKYNLLIENAVYKNAYALDMRDAEISLDPIIYQCALCGRISPHHIRYKCLTPSCAGSVKSLNTGKDAMLYGYKRAKNFPKLGMKTVEHTAQLDLSILSQNEKDFTDGKINLLSSSTTMELGIDIGGLTSIFLTNCPPGPSNYLQRAGRAGRRSDRVAYVLTSARKVPLDHYFFLNPDLFFKRKPHDPYVSLNSNKIVIRHIHSYILREFFVQLQKQQKDIKISKGSNPLGVYGTVEKFFGFTKVAILAKPPITLLLDWLENNPLLNNIDFLLKSTNLAMSFNSDLILSDIIEFFSTTYESLKKYIKELDEEIEKEQNNRRKNALIYHRRVVVEKDLVGFLIEFSFLPKYGFPVNIAHLNTVNKEIKIKNPNTRGRSKDLFRLQRNREVAIAEYAPGAKVVAGKKMLISEGISLDTMFGYESFQTDDKIETMRYIVCKRCGNFFVIPQTLNDKNCPVCGLAVKKKADIYNESLEQKEGNKIKYAILPKGFRVDYNKKQSFAPNKIEKNFNLVKYYPLLESNPEDFIQVIPDLLSIAGKTSAIFYAINQGPQSRGYTICMNCGRAIPEKDGPLKSHTRLYSNKPCTGQSLLNGRSLVSKFTTDAIQIRFKDKLFPKFANPLNANSFTQTFARVIQLASAKYLGLDDRELRFIIQNYWDQNSTSWENLFEIVLYDNVPGGAGYSGMIRDLFWDDEFYEYLWTATECPDDCSSACPACLIAYSRDEKDDVKYNRHLVRDFLKSEGISSFLKNYVGKVKPTQGEHIVEDIIKDAITLLHGKPEGKLYLYFKEIIEEDFSIIGSKFSTILNLAKNGTDITLIFNEKPSFISNLHLIENLRLGKSLAPNKIHLETNITPQLSDVAAFIETERQHFIYRSYISSSSSVNPFAKLPYMRKMEDKIKDYKLNGKSWELPPSAKGMGSHKFQSSKIVSIKNISLWKELCDYFSLSYTKKIKKVYYSDRYLLNFTENICFLMILDSMKLTPESEVYLAVNSRRKSSSDFAFHDRREQKKFLSEQIKISNIAPLNLRMFRTTLSCKPTDPGNDHVREMLIIYDDNSTVKLTFDSGMSMIKPYIYRFWRMDFTPYKKMIKDSQNRNCFAYYQDSLVFKFPKSNTNSLASKFMDALQRGAIKNVN